MRLFLGLPWPAALTADLGSRAEVWEGRPGLRLVRPDNWHVTLRFLGETDPSRVEGLTTLVSAWARSRGPLTFVDRGWGCFGPRRSPQVVFLELEPMPIVRRAVDLLHKKLDEAGFTGDGKLWKPHATLAYGQGGDLGAWPVEIKGGRPPILFDQAVLYSSELGPEGSRYQQLLSVSFTNPPG